MKRITWDEYFMSIAFLISLRSPDAETRHGCVLVSKDNRILSTGYNGYPKGISPYYQRLLPNKRPEKYAWMCHSERNALANTTAPLKDVKAYVTGEPCNDCLMAMWQHGVVEVRYDGRYKCKPNTTNYNSDNEVREDFILYTGMKLTPLDVDFSLINKDTFQCSQNL